MRPHRNRRVPHLSQKDVAGVELFEMVDGSKPVHKFDGIFRIILTRHFFLRNIRSEFVIQSVEPIGLFATSWHRIKKYISPSLGGETPSAICSGGKPGFVNCLTSQIGRFLQKCCVRCSDLTLRSLSQCSSRVRCERP
jgi:hypothetical protein